MKTKVLILALVLALFLVVTGVALADGDVARLRWVLGGGASDSAAGDVTLRATLGQPVVGAVSGGDVTLGQGFWCGAGPVAPADQFIFLPVVVRDW
jgi:hypothetical protein